MTYGLRVNFQVFLSAKKIIQQQKLKKNRKKAFSVVIYYFCSLVFTDVCNFYDPQIISRFLMWIFKNINW